mmetsp:Transcript_8537/g.25647  ORF Transcript_8537/g.25647 Transcript_8537/m.25647 type:complete len:171 (-) Transcript_8537:404-916(-)
MPANLSVFCHSKLLLLFSPVHLNPRPLEVSHKITVVGVVLLRARTVAACQAAACQVDRLVHILKEACLAAACPVVACPVVAAFLFRILVEVQTEAASRFRSPWIPVHPSVVLHDQHTSVAALEHAAACLPALVLLLLSWVLQDPSVALLAVDLAAFPVQPAALYLVVQDL